jgi:deazaflavin-dependent oxidoreductase (nitroreductase family)
MTVTRRVPRLVPLLNQIAKPLLAAGVPMGYNGLLTVPGRTSGEPRTTPLAIIAVSGRRWVWSPWGEVQWVRNLRAAGRAVITIRGHDEQVRAVELDPTTRFEFFRDTFAPLVRSIPFGATFVRLLDGVDVDDPERAAEGRTVFELLPTSDPRRGDSSDV